MNTEQVLSSFNMLSECCLGESLPLSGVTCPTLDGQKSSTHFLQLQLCLSFIYLSDHFLLPCCLDLHFRILFISHLRWSLRAPVRTHVWHFFDTTFPAFVLSAVSAVLDSSHTVCQPPLSPRLLAVRARHSCLCLSECSVSLPTYRVVGAQLSAYPGTRWSALWSNYLIWGNYL